MAQIHAYDRDEKVLSESDFKAAYNRVEEGRKAIGNEQTWKEFLTNGAKWTGTNLAAGAVQATGGNLVGLVGQKFLPNPVKEKLSEEGGKLAQRAVMILVKKQI